MSGRGRTVLGFIYHMFNPTFMNNRFSPSHRISTVRSIRELSSVSSTNNFGHPKLSKEE